MTDYNTIANFEKIIVERCSECGRTSSTMFRLRNGFTITSVVCEHCYNAHKYYIDRIEYQTFSKNDSANKDGLKSVKQSSSFMRLHQNKNFYQKEDKERKLQKIRNRRTHIEAKELLRSYYEILFFDVPEEQKSISGQYTIIEYTTSNNEVFKVYYTIDLVGKIIPRFLMNSKGKIIEYL